MGISLAPKLKHTNVHKARGEQLMLSKHRSVLSCWADCSLVLVLASGPAHASCDPHGHDGIQSTTGWLWSCGRIASWASLPGWNTRSDGASP